MTNTQATDATVDLELVKMIDAVLAEHRATRPRSAPITRDIELWSRLDQLGLVRLSGSERSGGSGAGWHEAAELISAAVRHGVRAPLAEHDVLACWLLEAVGAPVDEVARTVCILDVAAPQRRCRGPRRLTGSWSSGRTERTT